MRNVIIGLFALFALGCAMDSRRVSDDAGIYSDATIIDAVSVCVERCENRKEEGCESLGTDCNMECAGYAEDWFYPSCEEEAIAYLECVRETPTCATPEIQREFCSQEWNDLEVRGCIR